ncbi:acyltransferase family protein [Pseudomonas tolaasii]|uniref:acyltransferase family protein n=1 Tax=Pseudomonas tolaasii TaxID=29442 RepID=UPI0027335C6D|nr:acyltransferase [Pseudomonas tolaasii]WLH49719.1 acyltransferase [Pseudomonas tolaasii]
MNTPYALHMYEILIFLGVLFVCALSPMIILPRLVPSLVPSEHPKTKWLDGLRGIAAVLVSLNHAPLVLINLAIVPHIFYMDIEDSKILKLFGAVGVQIFFCITGLLFASKILGSKPIDWTDFFIKRIRRIVPAFFAAAILALIIGAWYSWPLDVGVEEVLSGLPAMFGFGLLDMPVINGFNFARLLGVSWTLAIEWKFYLVLPVVYILIGKNKIVTIASLLVFAVCDLYINNASSWVYFISGGLCFFLASKEFNVKVRVLAGVVAAILFVAIFYRWNMKANYGLGEWLSVSAMFAALTISRPAPLTSKVLVAMGSVSYSYYLLHAMMLFFVIGAIHTYYADVGYISQRLFVVILGATLALSTLLSTVSFVFIERRFMSGGKLKAGRNAATRAAPAAI